MPRYVRAVDGQGLARGGGEERGPGELVAGLQQPDAARRRTPAPPRPPSRPAGPTAASRAGQRLRLLAGREVADPHLVRARLRVPAQRRARPRPAARAPAISRAADSSVTLATCTRKRLRAALVDDGDEGRARDAPLAAVGRRATMTPRSAAIDARGDVGQDPDADDGHEPRASGRAGAPGPGRARRPPGRWAPCAGRCGSSRPAPWPRRWPRRRPGRRDSARARHEPGPLSL